MINALDFKFMNEWMRILAEIPLKIYHFKLIPKIMRKKLSIMFFIMVKLIWSDVTREFMKF